MVVWIRRFAWVLVLWGGVSVEAQDKTGAPPQKAKGAVEKLLRTPSVVDKSVQDSADRAKANLAEAAGQTKPTNTNPEAPVHAEKTPNPPSPQSPSVAGRRDPFRPFTLNTRTGTRPREGLSPLERYDLGQLRLVGVIWQVKEPNALIEDSVGLGYIVKIGTPIGANDGKVKAIKADEIIIEETYVDFFGAKKRREVNIKLAVEKTE
jgi:type IV pilus assembly protein PilP